MTRSTALLAVIAFGLCIAEPYAANAGAAARQSVTPVVRLAQNDYDENYFGAYRPACPQWYYYTCWDDARGYRHCGCLPGVEYYLLRYH